LIKINLINGHYYFRLGLRLEKLEKWDEAIKAYSKATSLNASKGYWKYRLGYSFQKLKRWDDSIIAYKGAIKINNSKALWYYRLGYVLQKAKLWDESIISYKSAIKLDGEKPLWKDRLNFVINKSKETFPNGLVETFSRKKISGWVFPKGDKEEVLIKVNGQIIDKIYPGRKRFTNNSKKQVGFARVLKSLWKYIAPEDVVEVEYSGNILPIDNKGFKYIYKKSKKKSRVSELLNKINEGYIFNKYGKLKLSIVKNKIWKESIFELFNSLKRDLKEGLNLDLIPTYGTMLGAVREGEFISHDNDFDTCIISKKYSSEAVKIEFIKMCEFLIDKGYKIRPKKSHIWVYVKGKENKDFKLDIFISYFNKNNKYEIAYGYHGPAVEKSSDFFKYNEIKLSGFTISIPSNYREILRQFYGDTWEIPDPGFKHQEATRTWDINYHLSNDQMQDIYWKQFYKYKLIYDHSPFSDFINQLIPPKSKIVELGCGSGEDAIFFSQKGHIVYACDKAKEAFQNKDINNINFSNTDISDLNELSNFINNSLSSNSKTYQEKNVIYMRFFLNHVSEKSESIILKKISYLIPKGTTLALEFRTTKDVTKKYKLRRRFIRLISMQKMLKDLQNYRYKIDYSEENIGLSNIENEDPYIGRIVAKKL